MSGGAVPTSGVRAVESRSFIASDGAHLHFWRWAPDLGSRKASLGRFRPFYRDGVQRAHQIRDQIVLMLKAD